MEPHHADAGNPFRPTPRATHRPLRPQVRRRQGGRVLDDKKGADSAANPENIALYMGHHIGFLGSHLHATNMPGHYRVGPDEDGLLSAWRRLSDPPDYNPYEQEKTISFDVGPAVCDLYDTVSGQFIRRNVSGKQPLAIEAIRAMVGLPLAGRHDVAATARSSRSTTWW